MTSHLRISLLAALGGAVGVSMESVNAADSHVMILDVPDYSWYAGCFPTASGNLMGFWDRNGFPNFYTGPTGGGLAPLNSNGTNAGIRSMWASKAGFDGRDMAQPGHTDDYWTLFIDESTYSYRSTKPDPHVISGRPEHSPDCLGDFMGASQNRWADFDSECSGNIDAFAFNFWDKDGNRRVNFVPPDAGAIEVRDVQSGIAKFAKYRGYEADTFSQLVDFNPNIVTGKGFTFQDLKSEIDAGFPVLLFLQKPNQFSQPLPDMPKANPEIHGMLAYGYREVDPDLRIVRYRTSWGDGRVDYAIWTNTTWEAGLPCRGVIGFRPKPKITGATKTAEGLLVKWDGPLATVQDNLTGAVSSPHRYVVEKSDSLEPGSFAPVTDPAARRDAVIPDCCDGTFFLRVKLLAPETPAP